MQYIFAKPALFHFKKSFYSWDTQNLEPYDALNFMATSNV